MMARFFFSLLRRIRYIVGRIIRRNPSVATTLPFGFGHLMTSAHRGDTGLVGERKRLLRRLYEIFLKGLVRARDEIAAVLGPRPY